MLCVKNGSGHKDLSGKVIFMCGDKNDHGDGLFSQNKQRLSSADSLHTFNLLFLHLIFKFKEREVY